MNELMKLVVTNLENVYIGMLLFVLSYVSNILISMFYNVKIIGVEIDKEKFLTGLLKMVTFSVGIGILCMVVTSLPIFANHVGFVLPDEYVKVFDNIVIIGAFLIASCKYVAEAIQKLNSILNKN